MKGLNILAAILIGATLIACISCSSENESPSTTPTPTSINTSTPPYYPPLPTVTVNESNSGEQVNLVINAALIVTLASNPGSTGFSWNLSAISDTGVIQYVSDEYVAPEQTDPPIVGQPGQEVWYFSAKGQGTATISMRYIQPWMPDAEPADTFDITVTVE